MSEHVSAFHLDALVLEALPPGERARVQAHLAGCARCSDRLSLRNDAGERFVAEVLPRTAPALLARRRRRARRPVWPLFLVVPALAAAGLLMVARGRKAGVTDGDLTWKGAPPVRAFARRDARTFELSAGTPAAPGDAVRFVVGPTGAPWLLVASVDADGHAQVYFPFGGKRSGAVDPSARLALPDSVILDETPGPERVFVFASREPLDAGPVLRALEALGAGGAEALRKASRAAVPAQTQSSLVIEKVKP
jgi:anti-sigma factor RsiW